MFLLDGRLDLSGQRFAHRLPDGCNAKAQSNRQRQTESLRMLRAKELVSFVARNAKNLPKAAFHKESINLSSQQELNIALDRGTGWRACISRRLIPEGDTWITGGVTTPIRAFRGGVGNFLYPWKALLLLEVFFSRALPSASPQ